MASILTILFIIVGVVGALLMFKIVKSILKTVLFVLAIFIFFALIYGYFVYNDYKSLEQNFPNSTKMFILTDGNKLVTGFTIDNFTNIFDQNSIGSPKLDWYTLHYKTKNYNLILEKNYKLIFVNLSVFNNSLNDGLTIRFSDINITFNRSEINKILYSENAMDLLLEDIVVQLLIKNNKPLTRPNIDTQKDLLISGLQSKKTVFTNEDAKNFIFEYMILDLANDQGPKPILNAIKKKEVIIYPETPFFVALKYSTVFVPEKAMDNYIKYTN